MMARAYGWPRMVLMGVALAAAVAFGLPVLAADAEHGRDQAVEALEKHIAALEEVKAKVPAHAQDAIQRAIGESGRLLEETQAAADRDHGDGQEGLEQALAAVEAGTQRHLDMLQELLDREDLPDEAREAVERAMAVSATGRMVAMERLGLIRSGEMPRGRPDVVRPADHRPEGVRPHAGRPGSGPHIGPRPR